MCIFIVMLWNFLLSNQTKKKSITSTRNVYSKLIINKENLSTYLPMINNDCKFKEKKTHTQNESNWANFEQLYFDNVPPTLSIQLATRTHATTTNENSQ